MYTKLKTYKENILVPRNLEGRQDKLKQEAIKLLSQETIKGDFQLYDYMLDIPEELIKVKIINGNFYCCGLDLKELPKWFEKLTIGDKFFCSHNQLTSLKGCPQTIGGDFSCSFNQLTTLEYGPQTVGGNYSCYNNQLTSLKGCPQTINNSFYCHNNNIILQRPENCEIKGKFYN